jgi:hypothetical protein
VVSKEESARWRRRGRWRWSVLVRFAIGVAGRHCVHGSRRRVVEAREWEKRETRAPIEINIEEGAADQLVTGPNDQTYAREEKKRVIQAPERAR